MGCSSGFEEIEHFFEFVLDERLVGCKELALCGSMEKVVRFALNFGKNYWLV